MRSAIARHEECYVVPEMVRISPLPVPEWHGISPLLPPMPVHIALVMYFKTYHHNPRAHMLEDSHLIGVIVPLSIPELCLPVMVRILCDRVGDLPVCAASAPVLADLERRMCPVYNPALDSLSRKVLSPFMSGSP